MFSFVEFAVGVKVSGGFAFGRVPVCGKDVFQFVSAFGYNGFSGVNV